MEMGNGLYKWIEDGMTDVGRMSMWTKEVQTGLGLKRKWDFAWDIVSKVLSVSEEHAA